MYVSTIRLGQNRTVVKGLYMPITFFLDRYTARGTPVRNKNIKVSVLYENRFNNRQKCGSVSALILSICSLV